MRKPAKLFVLLLSMLPVSAMALGLGNINLKSALNQPLDAEIELVATTQSELDTLTVSLASADAFASYGLDRPAFLLGMRFNIVRNGSGGARVLVTTTEPVREPFVTFLVEADWSRGRLLREYTVLLDPPVFMTEQAAPAPARAATPAVTEQPSGAVAREPARPVSEPVSPAPSSRPVTAAPRSDALSTRYGPIRRNETLWTIASRLRPDRSVSINQMMIALFRENPQAFIGNINRLKQGAVLRVPSAADIYALSSDEAFAEVRRQNAAWRGSRPATRSTATTGSAAQAATTPSGPGGRLRLVPPGDAARQQAGQEQASQGAVPDSQLAGNAALSQRIQALEGELENAQRLIEVKDSELAALQARLEALEARLAAEQAGTGEPVTESVDIPAPGEEVSETAPVVDQQPAEELAETEAQPVEAEEPPPVVVSPPVEEPKGFLSRAIDAILGAWLWILGLIGLGLVAAFAFLMRKRASDDEYSDSWETGEWQAPQAAEAAAIPAPAKDEPDTESQPAPQFERDESFVVVEAEDTITEEAIKPPAAEEPDDFAAALGDAFEDTGTFTPGELEVEKAEQIAGAAQEDEGEFPFEDTMIGHDALKLDESDPVAEADFHMAYGLYDQAAALVERAVEKEPDRSDLKAKLLEIFFVWGNKDRFLEEARAYKTAIGDADAGEWEKIVIMGKQLAPDESLFEIGTSSGVMAAPDLEFADDDEGEGTATDLDILGGDDADDALSFDLSEDADQAGGANDELDSLAAQIEKQIEPSEETLDLGSTDLDVDLDFDADGDASEQLESTGVGEAIESQPSPEQAVGAAGGDVLDEDLDIDLDFEFEDVSDDEPTAVMEEAQDDEVEQMLGSAGDEDATRVQDLSGGGAGTGSDETMLAESADFDSFTDGDDKTVETPLASDDEAEDYGATMQMPRIDLGDAEAGGDADDTLAARAQVDDDATRQIEQVEFEPGGDETVQISRDDLGSDDDDQTVQVSYGDLEGDLTTQLPAGDGANGADYDEEEDESTQKLQALDLPDEEQTDEVGTKLDLAKAFVDMGDPDGARNILYEVLDEGNDSQKQEAQSLLDNLG